MTPDIHDRGEVGRRQNVIAIIAIVGMIVLGLSLWRTEGALAKRDCESGAANIPSTIIDGADRGSRLVDGYCVVFAHLGGREYTIVRYPLPGHGTPAMVGIVLLTTSSMPLLLLSLRIWHSRRKEGCRAKGKFSGFRRVRINVCCGPVASA